MTALSHRVCGPVQRQSSIVTSDHVLYPSWKRSTSYAMLPRVRPRLKRFYPCSSNWGLDNPAYIWKLSDQQHDPSKLLHSALAWVQRTHSTEESRQNTPTPASCYPVSLGTIACRRLMHVLRLSSFRSVPKRLSPEMGMVITTSPTYMRAICGIVYFVATAYVSVGE